MHSTRLDRLCVGDVVYDRANETYSKVVEVSPLRLECEGEIYNAAGWEPWLGEGEPFGEELLRKASAHEPYSAEEEALLAALWLGQLEEGEVTQTRRARADRTLKALLWGPIENKMGRRGGTWTNAASLPGVVVEELVHELGAKSRYVNVREFQEHLRGRGDGRTCSQLMHRAAYAVLDALRTSYHAQERTCGADVTCMGDDSKIVDRARQVELVLPPGVEAFSAFVNDDPNRGRESAPDLISEIRETFWTGLEAHPKRRELLLLEFMSLCSRTRVAEELGLNPATLRSYFRRSGSEPNRKKLQEFVRAIVPETLRPGIEQFGEVFPVLQFGLFPREHELLLAPDAQQDTLRWLFADPGTRRGRQGTWQQGILEAAARDLNVNREEVVQEVVLPFLEAVVAERRENPDERGLELLYTHPPEFDALSWGLLLLVAGRPDGHGLKAALRARQLSPTALAEASGRSRADVQDLALGARWASLEEVRALARALEVAPSTLRGLLPAFTWASV